MWRSDEKPTKPILLTCLLILDGHALAIVDGVLYDNCADGARRW